MVVVPPVLPLSKKVPLFAGRIHKRRLIATHRSSPEFMGILMLKAECSWLPLCLHSVILLRPFKTPSFWRQLGVLPSPSSDCIGGSSGSDSSNHSEFFLESRFFHMFKEVKNEAMRSFMSPPASNSWQLSSFHFECSALSQEKGERGGSILLLHRCVFMPVHQPL